LVQDNQSSNNISGFCNIGVYTFNATAIKPYKDVHDALNLILPKASTTMKGKEKASVLTSDKALKELIEKDKKKSSRRDETNGRKRSLKSRRKGSEG